ncbi:hypothetical protein [Pontibacter diazotrophicus]|nr:hypothetical protein [Pontibacter diazotrophicus]
MTVSFSSTDRLPPEDGRRSVEEKSSSSCMNAKQPYRNMIEQ